MFIAVGPIWFVITMYILHLFLNSNVKVEYTSEMLRDDLKILSVVGVTLVLIFVGVYLFETNEQGYKEAENAQQIGYDGCDGKDKGVEYWKQKYSNK